MKKVVLAVFILPLLFSCKNSQVNSMQENAATENKAASGRSIMGSTDSSAIPLLFFEGYEKIMAENKGKVILLNFFGSWCPPCKLETPGFVKAYNENKDKNFIIIGIAVDKNQEDIKKFIDEYKITYPVYQADESLIRYFNIGPIPTSFIFHKDGTLLQSFVGFISEAILTQIVALGEK